MFTQVQENLKQVQNDILTSELTTESLKKIGPTGKLYKEALIAPKKFHFTLHVFHAADNTDLVKCVSFKFEIFYAMLFGMPVNGVFFMKGEIGAAKSGL